MSKASEEAKPQQRYQVVAPMIVVRVPRGPGDPAAGIRSARTAWQLVHLSQRAILPADVHPDDIERLGRTRVPGPRGGQFMIQPIELA